MRLGLINSAWAQAGRETAYGLRRTREIGFDCVDIFADPLDLEPAEQRQIRQTAESLGLPIVSVCCVAIGLIDLNPSVRRFHVDRVRSYLDFVKELGGKNLLLVLGEYLWQKEVIAPAEQWGWAVEGLQSLGVEAAQRGLEIAMELEPFKLSLLNDVPSMSRFLNDVGQPATVRANVDISHLVLSSQSASSLEALRGRVAHVHISDCDGKVHGDLPPGRGVVKFGTYLKKLGEIASPETTVSIELEYSPEPDQIDAWVEEAFASTSRLMAEAGLRTEGRRQDRTTRDGG
jgi:sugar phosphate isomerase/epimerase